VKVPDMMILFIVAGWNESEWVGGWGQEKFTFSAFVKYVFNDN